MKAPSVKVLFVVGGGRFFGGSLPIGGAASYVRAAARALPRERYETAFVFLFDGPSAREFSAAGLRTVVAARRFRGDPSVVWRLARVIRKERPDVVITGVTNANLYGRLAARLAGSPPVVTVIHDFMRGIMADTGSRPFLERLAFLQERLLWRLNARIVAVSGPLRGHLVRDWGIPEERVAVVPGVVDAGEPPPPGERVAALRARLCGGASGGSGGHGPANDGGEGDAVAGGVGGGSARNGDSAADGDRRPAPPPFLAGTICRLVPVKNLPMFLAVARRVEKEAPGLVRFALAGEGPQRAALEADARAMGLEGTVRFAGWIEDAAAFAAACDCHLLTSWTESQGISLLEAMAASRPVVATAVGGVTEVVADGGTGFLVDPGDDEAMARFVVELARDPELGRRMGAAGRRRVEEFFSLEAMRRGLEALIAEVLSGTKR